MVFSVHNNLTVPISVQSITSTLDTTDYPAPPAVCAGSYLTLPAYSGSFGVPGSGNATSPGVPIELMDGGTNQNACKTLTYHFTYSASAIYTDATTTTLASAPNASTSGQSVTFTATVTASNASTDSSRSHGNGDVLQLHDQHLCVYRRSYSARQRVASGPTARPPSPRRHCRWARDYIEATYGGSGYEPHGEHVGLMTQTVTSGSHPTASVLDLVAQPVELRHLGHLHRHGLVGLGHASRHGDLLQLHHQHLLDEDLARDEDPRLGQGHLLAPRACQSAPPTSRPIYGASGNYVGSTSNVVSQVVSALGTTSSPHLVTQPVGLRRLGHLHRHGLVGLGHPERAR